MSESKIPVEPNDVLTNTLLIKQFKISLAKLDHAVDSYSDQIDNAHNAALIQDRQNSYEAAKKLGLEIKRTTLEHRKCLLEDLASVMKSVQEYRSRVNASVLGTPVYNNAIRHLVKQLETENFSKHIGEYGYSLNTMLKIGLSTYSLASGARIATYTKLMEALQSTVLNWMKITTNFTRLLKLSQTKYIHESAVYLTLFRRMYLAGPARRDQAILAERTKVIRNGYTKDNCNRYASQTMKVGATLNQIRKVIGDYVKQNMINIEGLDKIVNDIIFLISKN